MSEQIKIAIAGMTCAACSARVERGLGKMPGVESATVNLPLARGVVIYDPAVVSAVQILAKVEDIGYGAEQIPEETPVFRHQ